MSPLHALLRGVHIAVGFAALGIGLAPLLTEKGGRAHRLCGKIYFYGLGLVAVTAAALAARGRNLFLLSLAVLTLYFLVTGRRALGWRGAAPAATGEGEPGAAPAVGRDDWGLAGLLLALSLASALFQLTRPVASWGAMTVVGVVFGVLGSAAAARDLRLLHRLAQGGQAGIFEHLMRMIASYIAAATAFSVTNLRLLPPLVRWLWPTVAGTLLITFLARRLALAQAAARAAAEAAALAATEDPMLPTRDPSPP